LHALAEQASKRGMVIGLENEHACNAGTGAEASRLLSRLDHPALKVVWDPANASILGETPYPGGYSQVPADRIVHVHAKDCLVRDQKPVWGAVGEMGIDWKGQLAALERDGYRGWISLETHWTGPSGDKFEASTICGRNLKSLVASR
jgi:L-ribulose-5-phosphate 3-epimerase